MLLTLYFDHRLSYACSTTRGAWRLRIWRIPPKYLVRGLMIGRVDAVSSAVAIPGISRASYWARATLAASDFGAAACRFDVESELATAAHLARDGKNFGLRRARAGEGLTSQDLGRNYAPSVIEVQIEMLRAIFGDTPKQARRMAGYRFPARGGSRINLHFCGKNRKRVGEKYRSDGRIPFGGVIILPKAGTGEYICTAPGVAPVSATSRKLPLAL